MKISVLVLMSLTLLSSTSHARALRFGPVCLGGSCGEPSGESGRPEGGGYYESSGSSSYDGPSRSERAAAEREALENGNPRTIDLDVLKKIIEFREEGFTHSELSWVDTLTLKEVYEERSAGDERRQERLAKEEKARKEEAEKKLQEEKKAREFYIESLSKCIVKKPEVQEVSTEESFGPHSKIDGYVFPALVHIVPRILDGSAQNPKRPEMKIIQKDFFTLEKSPSNFSCNNNGQEKMMMNLGFVKTDESLSDLSSCTEKQSRVLNENANEILKELNRSVDIVFIGRNLDEKTSIKENSSSVFSVSDFGGQKEKSLPLENENHDILDNNQVSLPLGISIVPEWNPMMNAEYNFKTFKWKMVINFAQKDGQCNIFSKGEIFKEINKLKSNNADQADLSKKNAEVNTGSRTAKPAMPYDESIWTGSSGRKR